MSPAELLLETQLRQAGIPFSREYKFAPEDWCRANGFVTPTGRPKRWRADFHVWPGDPAERWYRGSVLIEVDGGGFVGGRHGRGIGMEKDAEKQSAAAMLGFKVIRATPRQVEDGRCLAWVRAALGTGEREAA